MNKAETLKIMSLFKAAYPKFYEGKSRQELENIVTLWQEMFDEPYPVVAAAVKALICTDSKGFPPVIGQVKEKIRMLTHQRDMTELEAWGYVSNALRNSTYGAKEEYDKLPDEVKAIVRNPEQLREWAAMEPSEVQTVVASNFQRSFRGRIIEERKWQALPEDIKEMHRQLTEVATKPMPELPSETEQGRIEQKNEAIRRFKAAEEVRDFLVEKLGKAFAPAQPEQGKEMTPEEAEAFERRRREMIAKMKETMSGGV